MDEIILGTILIIAWFVNSIFDINGIFLWILGVKYVFSTQKYTNLTIEIIVAFLGFRDYEE